MADLACTKCGKDFQSLAHLKRHNKRKTPCDLILDPKKLPANVLEDPNIDRKKCRFCDRTFGSYTAMRRHVREACKIAPNEKNGDTGMEMLYEHTQRRQQAEIDELRAQLAYQAQQNEEMMGLMRRIAAQQSLGEPQRVAVQANAGGDSHVAVDNSKKTNNMFININFFGQENADHVTAEKIREIMEESIGMVGQREMSDAAQEAVLKTAMLVYSDPSRPENLTCYMPNKKTKDALVHTREGWEVRPVSLVITPMATRSIDALFDKQPFEDADMFEPLMVELRDNERKYAKGKILQPVLVRNKELLNRALKTLPVAGAGKEEAV